MIERYVTQVVRHRVAVLVAIGLVTVFFGFQLRHLRLEIRRRANLPDQHPYVQVQNRISDLFGGEAVAIIGVVANQGTIYTPEILGKVYRITESLRDEQGVVQSSLFSLSAPHVKAIVAGPDGAMDIHPLLDRPPQTPGDIERVRKEVREDHFFRGNLVSSDETATVIVADFDASVTDADISRGIEAAISAERDSTVTIALAGAPILRAALAKYTAMIGILFPLAVVIIGLIHYEAFRTLQAMILPLLTALLSVVWALGIMGALDLPMDTWSAMTPVLILAVAAGHAVQILKRYYEEYARIGDADAAVIRAVTAVGPVMLTAGSVAAAGFGSLMTFGVMSVRVFGLLLASGIVSALIIEMTFTPACRSLLPAPKTREMRREGERRWLDRVLEALANLVVRQPLGVILSSAAVVAVVGFGAHRIQVDNSFRYWFSPSTQVRKDDDLLNEKLPGTATIRLLVEGEEEGVLKKPEVLAALDDLQAFIAKDPLLGGVTSIVNYVKRMHQASHDGDPAFYRVPEREELIAQYLALYEMSGGPEGLSAFVDSKYERAVVRALSKTDSAAFSRDLILRLEQFSSKRFRGLPATVRIAGGTLGVQTAMNDVVVSEKIANVVQVTAIIFLLCAGFFRSLVGASLVLVPLVVAVIVTLGLMGWTNTWLDMTTAAITAMGVSIGADFSIYLIFRIREEWRKGPSLEGAIRAALHSSGKAIFFVSSAVAAGYMVLPFSGFSLWMRLGVLTATIVSVSALASLTLVPSLALILEPRFLRERSDAERNVLRLKSRLWNADQARAESEGELKPGADVTSRPVAGGGRN